MDRLNVRSVQIGAAKTAAGTEGSKINSIRLPAFVLRFDSDPAQHTGQYRCWAFENFTKS